MPLDSKSKFQFSERRYVTQLRHKKLKGREISKFTAKKMK